MQAATAPDLKTARETLFGEEQVGPIREDVNLNAHRYFVQMGWSVLGVDTHAIPNGRLLRGEITPCRTYKQKANLLEIREGELIPESKELDRDGKEVWGSYYRYAFHEAERLVELETRAERQTGLFEMTALNSVLGTEVYRKVNLNALFFPDWPRLPEKTADVVAVLEARIAQLKASTPPDMPAHYLPVIFDVGDQLLEAARRADFVQKHLLNYTHTCLKLTPKDDGFKRSYDSVDYEMLRRTGMPEVHAAEVQTAQALEKLSERQDENSLKDLVEVMKIQAEQNAQIIQLLLAERTVPTRGKAKD